MGEFEHIQKRHVSKRGRISELILFCIESFRLGSSRNEKLQSGYMVSELFVVGYGFEASIFWFWFLSLFCFCFRILFCFVFLKAKFFVCFVLGFRFLACC
jgi:hypothetical protein